ncbi:MAG: hypothetical protein U5L45_20550 [Saprospiraceae bacterium]|nr:hypothetical protein [Saprospiraceae bacterium]
MVHFSGKARKMNHIPPSRASEASAEGGIYDNNPTVKKQKSP